MRIRTLVGCVVIAALALPVLAANPTNPKGQGETDLGLSGFFGFTQSATGNNITHTTPHWYGGTAELRHIDGPLAGFEVAYSIAAPHYDTWSTSVPLSPPGFPCTPKCTFQPTPTTIQTFDQTFSLDWVPSMKVGNLRPFGILGAGAMLATPDNGQVTVLVPGNNPITTDFSLTSQVSAALIYGAGVDWSLLPRIGVRLQYRGAMYKDPAVAEPALYPATGSFVQTAEPTIGVFFKF
jgi:opacity protein-like surface antigen